MPYRLNQNRFKASHLRLTPMKDKICVITGATSGLGRATALSLARAKARVILMGRNEQAGSRLVENIRRKHGPDSASFIRVDLSDQSQVRTAAQTISNQHPAIDILINNAGARNDAYQTGSDGHELTFSCNHLGHFLLTCLLLEQLLAAPAARIITVSSGNHGTVPADGLWELPRESYDRREAYARSKMANIVLASALAERLRSTRVVSNIYEPGGVASNFARNNGIVSWGRHLLSHALRRDLASPHQAALGLARLALAPELAGVTGRYYRRENDLCQLTSFHHPEDATALWALSLELTSQHESPNPIRQEIARP
jgi:NAD(P)-dependent dehydrogenase (short-subunit alcohol dehydrogenase family)